MISERVMTTRTGPGGRVAHDASGRALHSVGKRHTRLTSELRGLLGDTQVGEDGQDWHGLVWWYPQVKRWSTVRSVGRGSGGGTALPLNAEAVDFVSGTYWADEQNRVMPQARTERDIADLGDPLNYRPGFEMTALGLECSVRRGLGQAPPPRRTPARDPLCASPAVTAALVYLLEFSPEIAADDMLRDLVRSEAIRLLVRSRGMLHGARWTASRGPCMHCHQPESVVSDGERAVCITPMCRTVDGERHCWRVDDEKQEWVAVLEPDLRGRGQVTDDQLSRYTNTA